MRKRQTQEYKGNGKHDWEFVLEDMTFVTERLRVPGGWLYRNYHIDNNDIEGMVFVPMPEVVKHKV